MAGNKTRIGIMGAGAIGCVVGGLLARAGHDVTLVDAWPEHVAQIKAAGLRLSGSCGEHLVPVRALHLHELQGETEPFDAVFVAVKAYDTEWAAALAAAYLRRPDGVVVDFQNGINDERVAAVAGRARTLGCVITISAGLYEPGHAIRTDRAAVGFRIGEPLRRRDLRSIKRLGTGLARRHAHIETGRQILGLDQHLIGDRRRFRLVRDGLLPTARRDDKGQQRHRR